MGTKASSARISLIISMVLFGTIGLFRRYIPLSSGLIALCRGLLGALCLFALCAIKGKPVSFRRLGKRLPYLCAAGACMGANWILLFEAYRYTTVAVATLCYYLAPTVMTLAAVPILKEKLTAKTLVCTVVALGGMALVSGVGGGSFSGGTELLGVLCGVGAAVLYASVILINKKAPAGEPIEGTAVQLLTAAAISLPYVLFTEDFAAIQIDALGIGLLVFVGVVITGFAYVLYFSSLQHLPAKTTAMLSYLDPVVAVLISATLLQEPFTLLQGIGAVLILGGAIVSEWKGKQKS